MARRLRSSLIWIVAAVVLSFVVFAVVRSAPRKSAPVPPEPAASRARIYGTIEPLGGPVYVAAGVPRSIVRIAVREGDTVKAGQTLVLLEGAVEEAQVRAALDRAAAAEKAAALSRDAYQRAAGLFATKGVSEQDYRQALLKAGLDSANAAAAEADAALARAQLEQLTLKSPVDGVVYKLDVQLGQTLAAGDDSRIIVGAAGQQARMFVESFWLGRLKVGASHKVFDSETNRELGTGRVVSLSPYVGGRTVRTDDIRERFDAEYQIAVLELDTAGLPLGLNVVAEIGAPPR
ncbi:efflux RND transporter periplasmic adaptor subunit [candidate division WOR-3 bacterium]|nr:efflux RND transporter periplasmic adaptor subunit [candidate division WOR-3 bacterium]